MRVGILSVVSLLVLAGITLAQVDPFAPDPVYTPPPARPANRAPGIPSEGVADLSEGLVWVCTDPDGDSLQFDVLFGAAGTDLAYVGTVASSTFAWPGVTLRAGEYQWRIEVRDEHGLVTVGPTWSFTVLADGTITATVDASIWASVAADTVSGVPSGSSEPVPGTFSQGPLTGMTFAWIPSGSFEMGSPATEPERDSDEGPLHMVQISGFEMMTTEVTQGLWEVVMGDNPSSREGSDLPVEYVDWNDCQDFVAQLNQLDSEYEYRLPSEAEWEYACRAGTTTAYYWGATMNGSYCWYEGNSDGHTHSAGSKLPNAWGLYDMSGNVWEWCEDWYHEGYYGTPPSDGSPWLSPSGSNRVARGGSWDFGTQYCRSAYRGFIGPGNSGFFLGLRLARTAL
jgi:formylglycine-generating enzyme required for sulfatase activity